MLDDESIQAAFDDEFDDYEEDTDTMDEEETSSNASEE
jgi:hypothetical protein